jgi:hypothetical protein
LLERVGFYHSARLLFDCCRFWHNSVTTAVQASIELEMIVHGRAKAPSHQGRRFNVLETKVAATLDAPKVLLKLHRSVTHPVDSLP